jgi:hypothetical protein
MSQLEVDKVIPQSGTTLTLGESGDTITIPSGATFSATLTAPVIDEINDTNGNEEIIFTTTASAVNELTIANAATGNAPEISATGGDTNIDLKLTPKGTGKLNLDGIKFPNADGSAGQFLQTDGSGVLSFSSPSAGITEADSWRLTTNLVNTNGDITANLERDDTSGFGYIGTGMTQSSGIFTFPSTGIYLITFNGAWNIGADALIIGEIYTTINNSTYTLRSESFVSTTGAGQHKSSSSSCFLDVTSTANCKVKFAVSNITTATLLGTTGFNYTIFQFIRLGDT